MAHTLNDLPKEVLLTIVDYLHRPTDFKRLCLTNKALNECALPRLYKTVHLDTESPGYPFQIGHGFFQLDHPVHPYVRSLRMEDKSCSEHYPYWIKLALQLLPRNCLRSFEADYTLVDESLFSLLCTQQCALTDFALGPLCFNAAAILTSGICARWMSTIQRLEIPSSIRSTDDLITYQTILRLAPNLSVLAIRTCHSLEVLPKELHDTDQEDGLLAETLFSHLRKNGAQQTLELCDLVLQNIKVTFAERTFAKFIDFPRLQFLRLYECIGSELFLSHLAYIFHLNGANLTEFFCSFDEIQPREIEDFLRSFRGLKTLYIKTYTAPPAFDSSCLLSHADTLEVLCISFGEVQGPASEGMLALQQCWTVAAKNWLRLQAFGLVMPVISLREGISGMWQQYGDTIESILSLPKLELLRILNWPEPPGQFFSDFGTDKKQQELNRRSYLQELDMFATELMRFMERRRGYRSLPVLCFGDFTWTAIYHGEEWLQMKATCYVPSKQSDFFGNTSTVALRRSCDRTTYDVMNTDILGHDV